MVFLDEFAVPPLYGAANLGKIPSPDLDGHKAVNQGKRLVKIYAENRSHEKT